MDDEVGVIRMMKSRARLVSFVCCDCGRDSVSRAKNYSVRPRKACDECFWSFPCSVCKSPVRYGDSESWRRAKKHDPSVRMHDECREKKRSDKERDRMERVARYSEPDRLSRIEKKLHGEWADKVRMRDGGKCMSCGDSSGGLHAHHIKPVVMYPYMCTYVPNGITLCYECHQGKGGVHGSSGALNELVKGLRVECEGIRA